MQTHSLFKRLDKIRPQSAIHRLSLKRRAIAVLMILFALGSLLPSLGVSAALLPPTITKFFDGITDPGVDTIHAGQTVVLSFTITNPNPAGAGNTLTGINFTDGLPPTIFFIVPITVNNTCGGTPTATNGGSSGSISLVGGSVPGGASCTISVNVTSNTPGSYTNTTGPVNAQNAPASNNTGTANLTVLPKLVAPTATKGFNPPTILPGGTSTLTITIPNPNSGANNDIPQLNVNDVLPAGLTLASVPTDNGNCIGTGSLTGTVGGNTITLTNGDIPPGQTCVITATVTASTDGKYPNTIPANQITFNGGQATGPATGSLSVESPLTFAKSFGAASFQAGTGTTLTLSITNPATNPDNQTNITFTDLLPGQMVINSPNGFVNGANCINPPLNANNPAPGSGTIAIAAAANLTVAPGKTCTLTVNVTDPFNDGALTNTTGPITGTDNGVAINGPTASANVTVTGPAMLPPVINKAFTPTTIPNGSNTTLTITIQNPNALAMTGVAFTDTLPAGIILNNPSGVASVNCGVPPATLTAPNGGNLITYANGTIPANTTCTITVSVVGVTVGGPYTNTTSQVTSANAGSGGTASAQITVTNGGPGSSPPTITKAFNPVSIAAGGVSTITFVITNSDAFNQFGVTFTDNLPVAPGALVVAPTPNASLTGAGCSGTWAPAAGAAVLTLTNGVIPANSSCTLKVDVTTPTAGTYNNTTGAISSTNTGTGATSNTATLTVTGPSVLPATITKAFAASPIPINTTTTLTFTLTNPNDGTAGTGVVPLINDTFTDGFPAGVVLASTTVGGTCVGGFTSPPAFVVGATTVIWKTASLPPGTCTITITVKGTQAGTHNNQVGTNKSDNGGTGAKSNITPLQVVAPPTVAKAFAPASISAGGTSTLTLTIHNPNPVSIGNVTGVGVVDVLPVGPGAMSATAVGAVNAANCGAAATWTISTTTNPSDTLTFANGSIPSGGTCALTATVLAPATGVYNNTTQPIQSANGGTGVTSNTATLTTNAALASLTIKKFFNPTTLPVNQISRMHIQVHNPANATQNGVTFTDTFPAGLVFASGAGEPNEAGNCNGGTVTVDTVGQVFSLSGGTLGANGSPTDTCDLFVDVTSANATTYTNSTQASSPLGGPGGTTSATITFIGPPTITKSFSPSTITLGQTSTATITLTNPNVTTALSGVAMTDILPTAPGNMTVASTVGTIDPVNCGAMVFNPALTIGAGTVSISGGTIPALQSCVITFVVTVDTVGNYTNTIAIGGVTTTNGGSNTSPGSGGLVVNAPTATPTNTPTVTLTPSNTPTDTPSDTATNTPPDTATNTPTNTPSSTDTPSNTPTITTTPTNTSTASDTPTATPTNTGTITPSVTPTASNTPTNTGTATNTPTNTATATITSTQGASLTGSGTCSNNTATFTITNTSGTALPAGTTYKVTNGAGQTIQSGPLTLNPGQTATIIVPSASGLTTLTLTGTGINATFTAQCGVPTSTPSSQLTGSGTCANGTAMFTLTDTGNTALPAGTTYTVTNSANQVVQSGPLALGPGQSTTITVPNQTGTITLTVNGTGISATFTAQCGVPSSTPSPSLTGSGTCTNGTASFTITNTGGSALPAGTVYIVTNGQGQTVQSGPLALGPGQSTTITVPNQTGTITLTVSGSGLSATFTAQCSVPTSTPSTTLTGSGTCSNGTATFVITNSGSAALPPGTAYVVTNGQGQVVQSGPLTLGPGQSTTITVTNASGLLTLTVNGQGISATFTAQCTSPTSTPSAQLTGSGTCTNGTATFTLTNSSASALPAGTTYTVTNGQGQVVKSGALTLGAGQTTTITVTNASGLLTLTVSGTGLSATFTAQCTVPTSTPSSLLKGSGACTNGTATFTLTDSGSTALPAGTTYVVTNGQGQVVQSGPLVLGAGQTKTITVPNMSGTVTLSVSGMGLSAIYAAQCSVVSGSPTPTNTPGLIGSGTCANGTTTFTLTNNTNAALPPGTTYTITNGNNQVVQTGSLVLNAGQSITITVTNVSGTVTLKATGTAVSVTFTAQCAAPTATPGTIGTPNPGVADPAITKSGSPTLARPGDPVTFTLTVTNSGTAPALSVIVTDALPSQFVFTSATAQQGTFSVNNNTITFNVGTVNPGQVITLTIVTRVAAWVVPPVNAVNDATLIDGQGQTSSSSAAIRITAGGLPGTGEHPTDDPGTPSALWFGLAALLVLGGPIAARTIRRANR